MDDAEARYTPEPWRIGRKPFVVRDGAGTELIDVCGAETTVAEDAANARRVVAAVNACVGIPTEELQQGIVSDLINAVRALLARPDAAGAQAFARGVLARIGDREPRRTPVDAS